jgi:hypothetical protein
MKIFISHSSRNLAAATALVDFLGKAFRLGSSDILCTSVEGHRLDGGTATPEALRQAIRSARVFIAIVSPESSASDYVLFEMGARWGSSLEIIPLLAPGEGAATLPSPLKDVHAPSISSHSDMHQLVDKLGRDHGWEAEPAASYQRSLDQLASLSPAAETRVSRAAIALHEGREHPVALGYAVKSAGGLERALSPDEILLLRGLISHPVPVVPEAGLTVSLDWHPYRTSAVVELLVDSSLVVKDEEADGIALTKQGKRACLEMGLFDQPR